ncbi:hypothetical protein WDW37_14610 [Bdellovibrionota bacterium FG-1]
MDTQNALLMGERVTYVLVEEDTIIHDDWLRIADAKGISLMTYPDAEWFLDDMRADVFRGNEKFYLDQDFGFTRGVGLRLSRQIKARWPHAYTALVTGYPKLLFRDELAVGWINDVFGKYPSPFDNPKITAIEEASNREIFHRFIKDKEVTL